MHYMWLDMNLCRLSPIKGSEVVIGRDGKKMLVKHSGIFVRVNTASPAKMAIKDISQCGSSAIDKTRELGSFDGSSSFKKKKKKNVEPGSFDGSRELGSFDSSSGFENNVEPGSFDGSWELGSFDSSYSLKKY
ncbi:unnamed protein product [Meganyctiphanes norvegica]|uniref:Uncharacterized protein n=1 Tax=Meganyctiphanes norvegica TaxID=48144 RepID=A0AAV2SQP3_MEGNR